MAIKLVTDSGADLLPAEAEAMGVRVVPLIVTFNGIEYRDSIDINHEQFFERLVESDVLPSTSQIPPAIFKEVFDEETANGDTVIVLTISSKLSGTYQNACIAGYDCSGVVYVVDTLSATVGQRLLLQSAIQHIEQGMSAREIVQCLEEERNHVHVLAMMDTLEYLKKGGRISAAAAIAGGILSIKPVITLKDGAIEVVGKARGSRNGNNLLRKLITDVGGVNFNRPYCLVYSGLSDVLLKKYIEDSADLWQ